HRREDPHVDQPNQQQPHGPPERQGPPPAPVLAAPVVPGDAHAGQRRDVHVARQRATRRQRCGIRHPRLTCSHAQKILVIPCQMLSPTCAKSWPVLTALSPMPSRTPTTTPCWL